MRFTKMHGLGNDFVVLDDDVEVTPELVRRVCDRHFGVGADGVLQVSSGLNGVRMGYWNADGSVAEMCGNGLRCVARRAWELEMAATPEFEIETPVGMRRVVVGPDRVSVDLGPVVLLDRVEINERWYRRVDVGNPHAVAQTDPDQVDVPGVGSLVEHHASFPQGTNVEFFTRTGENEVKMRVWERGVGETLACGTGIVAVAAVATEGSSGAAPLTVRMPGGTAEVAFTDGAWLTGPATTVFEGRWLSEPS